MSDKLDNYSLLAEWFDPISSLRRKFFLFYFLADNTVELFDIKNRRLFLKRTKVDGLERSDIYVGNTVIIFSRSFAIIDYANAYTMKKMGVVTQKTCGIIMPEAISKKSDIIIKLINEGFKISKLKMFQMCEKMAKEFYKSRKDSPDYRSLVNSMISGPVVAMELVADLGISKLRELAGPEDPAKAKASAPHTIRASFGIDRIQNGFYATDNQGDSKQEIELLFEREMPEENHDSCTATFKNSTLCLVKPHAVRSGHLGEIFRMIEENGYSINAMKMFYMDTVNAEEFYEVYKGVAEEYTDMVNELISGPCVAMEVSSPMDDTPYQFRKFAGPSDPEIANKFRPNTIRAKYGVNKVLNAVHVTDLPEDALLEVEYFFKILD